VITGALLVPSTIQANECGPPKRITVRWACGRVLDVRDEPITGIEVGLLLMSQKRIVATTTTDDNGAFDLFADPGIYHLYSKSSVWNDIQWPVKVSRSKVKTCNRPLYVVLAPKSGWGCTSWVAKKKPQLN
jgi:hypothetical protein